MILAPSASFALFTFSEARIHHSNLVGISYYRKGER